ncbi:MAG: FKBP-type peptidyl-prolyl cis-trans isomerase, partial [Saprospiraceae bacterium]|nr:FKBP-type peptidyl-prolyl cis-trans isomerase [Saprospiraceae bacterium]
MKSIQYALSLILMLSIIGCSKDKNIVDDTAQFELDKQLIRNYLKDNNLNADSTSEGVYYIIDYTNDTLPDKHASVSSIVVVDYKGYLLSGKVFETNFNQSFGLYQVIDGWKIGIPLFKQGEKGRLFLPSRLA